MAAQFPSAPYLQMIDELIEHFQTYESPLLYEAAIEAVEFCRITGRLETAIKYAKFTGDEQLVKDLEAELKDSRKNGKIDFEEQLRWK